MKKYTLFVFLAISASSETTLLTTFAEALQLLSGEESTVWPPKSLVSWLKKENLISAEQKLSDLPDGITAGIYRVRVVPQTGATCSINTWYNLAWFLLLLNAETYSEARYAQIMLKNSAALKEICTTRITDSYNLPAISPEIIDKLPEESKKYFSIVSLQNEIPSYLFEGNTFSLFYNLFVKKKRGAYGFRWYHIGYAHYNAFVAARAGNEFSFFILDSFNTDGPIDSENNPYAASIRNFIRWSLKPEELYKSDLKLVNSYIGYLTNDDEVRTNSYEKGIGAVKDTEDTIDRLDAADPSIFAPYRSAYEKIRDTRIAEWQKTDPTITLSTIRARERQKKKVAQ